MAVTFDVGACMGRSVEVLEIFAVLLGAVQLGFLNTNFMVQVEVKRKKFKQIWYWKHVRCSGLFVPLQIYPKFYWSSMLFKLLIRTYIDYMVTKTYIFNSKAMSLISLHSVCINI